MRKISMLFGLLLFALGANVSAQTVGSKAYASENLQQLSVNDRIRVLNKEYSDLSGGQRLQNDQLEFYLDQIEESGWTFSQVRQDMQESLGSHQDYGRPRPVPAPGLPPINPVPVPGPGHGDPYVQSIECASRRERYTECATPFAFPRLQQQLSRAPCIEGESWGSNGPVVWVNAGCRALFVDSPRPVRPPRPGTGLSDSFTCGSEDGRRNTCRTPFQGVARLRRQLSTSACIEGQTWGSSPGVVWVNRGCRGIFEEDRRGGFYPGPTGQSAEVVCASLNDGLRICAWDNRIGRPRLLREFSRGACEEGRTWGVDRRGLWVDQGCAGAFGIR